MITFIFIVLGLLFFWNVILAVSSYKNEVAIEGLKKDINLVIGSYKMSIDSLGYTVQDLRNESRLSIKGLETKLDLIAQHLKVKFELEPAKEAKLVIKK